MKGWHALALVAGAAILGGGIGALLAPQGTPGRRTSTIASGTQVTTVRIPRGRNAKPHTEPRAKPLWLNRRDFGRATRTISDKYGVPVGVAIRSLDTHTLVTAGTLFTGPAWSTIKVPLVLARYRLADERHEARAEIDDLARRAITESDNAAAAELFTQIQSAEGSVPAASEYVGRELVAAGDDMTTINSVPPDYGPYSTYGQTRWSLVAGTEFFRQLARMCVPPRGSVDGVLDLMANVIPAQRWGVGAARWRGATTVRFKGGWGPDQDGQWVVRQFGIVQTDRRGFVVGLITRGRSYEAGTPVLDALAAAVARATRIEQLPRFSGC